MIPLTWINGELYKPREARVGVDDHGFTVGDGVFETIAVHDGVPFALTRHINRLMSATSKLGLAAPDKSLLLQGVDQVLRSAPGVAKRLRITVTSGSGSAGVARPGGPLTIVITGGQAVVPTSCIAVRAPWVRNERAATTGLKTISYADNAMMAAYALERGANEAFIGNSYGDLCEGTGTNIFIERDGEILTPPLVSGCLPGIARGLALEWGVKAGLPVRAAVVNELAVSALGAVVAGDAFASVTSVTRQVQAVSSMDGAKVSQGPLLAELARIYAQNAAGDHDPAPIRANSR